MRIFHYSLFVGIGIYLINALPLQAETRHSHRNQEQSKTRTAHKARLLKGDALKSKTTQLATWPIVNKVDGHAVSNYIQKQKPLSISDPNRGVLGQFVRAFKKNLGLKNRKFAIPFNSGTNALVAAYRALGIQAGDKVAVAGYTFHATGSPLVGLGANVVLMDASPITGNVTANIVKEILKKNPDLKALAVNHNWGIPIKDIAKIKALCETYRVKLIEDCSHAHGAKVKGRAVGTFGDIAIFSTQNNKIVPTGEGGILLTDDIKINQRILKENFYRAKESYQGNLPSPSLRETGTGYGKMRMTPLSAVLGLKQLRRFKVVQARRLFAYKRLAKKLREIDALEMYEAPKGIKQAVYGIRVKYHPNRNGQISAEDFTKQLRAQGLDVHVGTSLPLNHQEIFQKPSPQMPKHLYKKQKRYTDKSLPGANEYIKNRIVFPVISGKKEDMKQVVDSWVKIINEQIAMNKIVIR